MIDAPAQIALALAMVSIASCLYLVGLAVASILSTFEHRQRVTDRLAAIRRSKIAGRAWGDNSQK